MKPLARRNPEQQLQMAVASFLRLALKPPTIWTAFPAGGGGRTRGAFLKAMGLQKGWPDIIVMTPAIAYPANKCIPMVLGIELKAAKGSLSREQKALAQSFKDAGGHYCVARSVDDVQFFIRRLGITLHASVGRIATYECAKAVWKTPS